MLQAVLGLLSATNGFVGGFHSKIYFLFLLLNKLYSKHQKTGKNLFKKRKERQQSTYP